MARPKKSARLWWAFGLAALLAAVVTDTVIRRGSAVPAKAPPTLKRLTFAPGLEDEPSFSPDGKFVAYTTDERGNLDVVVQPLGGGEPIRIASTEADEAEAAWSPDGSRIAYVSAQEHGGRLASALNVSTLEFYLNSNHGDIFVVPALGGTPAKLVEDGCYPSWSPDGKRLVFMSNRGRAGQSLDGERRWGSARTADERQQHRLPAGVVAGWQVGRLRLGRLHPRFPGFLHPQDPRGRGRPGEERRGGLQLRAAPGLGRRRAIHRFLGGSGRDPERLEGSQSATAGLRARSRASRSARARTRARR